tara:strand:+ start:345 stop:677 length:333 start_codon:yes stop_codon:yes gene_type:complete
MKDDIFLSNSLRAKQVMRIYLRENIDLHSIIILTEIVVSKIEKRSLPNIKWVETEFQISFTKVNAILTGLIKRKFIIKVPSKIDARVKYLDITKSGREFIYKITSSLVQT